MNNNIKKINFGLQPISNRFLQNKSQKAPNFLLEISWNDIIGCPQMLNPWPIDEVRPQYDWITCFEPEDHLDELCNIILNLKNYNRKMTIAAYSFKDDSTLARFDKLGIKKQWRIQPKDDLSIVNSLSNVETFQAVFNKDVANEISIRNGKADVLIVRHVLEHAYNISEFINSLKLMIKDDGYIVFELPDCEQAFLNGDCTTIWEEHTFYFFESSLRRCLENYNLNIVFWKKWSYPLENCMVAIVENKSITEHIKKNTTEINKDFIIYDNFIKTLEKRKLSIIKKLNRFVEQHGKICILGAGHLSIAFISLLQLTDYISYAIDDNDNKSGYFLPVGNIPIKKTKFLNACNTKLCLLGANPQHHNKIKNNLKIFLDNGGIICSIFPNTVDYLEDILK